MPFTITGDINDAVFPLLNEVLQNSNLLISLRKHYSIPVEDDSLSEEEKISTKPKRIMFDDRKKETKPIKSKTSPTVSPANHHSAIKYEEKKRPRKIVPKPVVTENSFAQGEKRETLTKFAEHIQRNEDEFQNFCDNYEQSFLGKQKVQTYPLAIFGPSPFTDIKTEPRPILPPRNKTILPLKFPWNGVFDTHTPIITWTNPTVFLFSSKRNINYHTFLFII